MRHGGLDRSLHTIKRGGIHIRNRIGEPEPRPKARVPFVPHATRGSYDPWVGILYGRRGNGKTLSAAWIARYMQQQYRRLRTGQRVISNLYLAGAMALGPVGHETMPNCGKGGTIGTNPNAMRTCPSRRVSSISPTT